MSSKITEGLFLWRFGMLVTLLLAFNAAVKADIATQINIEPARLHLWSGETAEFTAQVISDQLGDADWELHWEFVLSPAVLDKGKSQLTGFMRAKIPFKTPQVRHVSEVKLQLRLMQKERSEAEKQVLLRIYPTWEAAPLQRLLTGNQITFVGSDKSAFFRLLSGHGLTGTVISTTQGLQSFDGKVIVLGPEAGQTPELTRAVLETASAGKTVVWMEAGEVSRWRENLGLPSGQPEKYGNPIILAEGHPLLSNFVQEDLVWWQREEKLGTASGLPEGGNFRGLVAASNIPVGFWLVELFPGEGRIIICQLPVVSRFHDEPAARMLFEALLRYALSETPQFHAAEIWAPPGSGLHTLAKKAGVEVTEKADAAGVMIVEAEAEAAKYALTENLAVCEKIRAHLEGGGKGLLIGAGPESVEFLKRCGLGAISFEPAPQKIVFETRPVPLVWGIASKQLGAAAMVGEETLPKYVLSADSKVAMAVSPGIIAKAAVGRGEAILCQLALDRAPDEPAVVTLFQELLTNLRVRLKMEN